MPSAVLGSYSGGVAIVSGDIFSGSPQLVGGVRLFLASGAPGVVYVAAEPALSGGAVTITSGGGLSSGGLTDGVEFWPGQDRFIPKVCLVSGIQTIRVAVPAASSGARLFWQPE